MNITYLTLCACSCESVNRTQLHYQYRLNQHGEMDGDVFVFDSVKEEVFWRNYFYRVSLIKQSAQLTALAAQQQQQMDGEDRGANASPEDVVLTGQTFTTAEVFHRGLSPHQHWPLPVLHLPIL